MFVLITTRTRANAKLYKGVVIFYLMHTHFAVCGKSSRVGPRTYGGLLFGWLSHYNQHTKTMGDYRGKANKQEPELMGQYTRGLA